MATTPNIQLPRLEPIFPANGSKGNTTVDIIAVHGLETISPKTWTAYEQDTEPKGRSFYWLQDADMLPSVIPGARIWVFDYNSIYSHNAQTVWIDGLAVTLLECIKNRYDQDFASRRLVFVGSCFGGIVVAASLEMASREVQGTHKRAIFDQTAGVIFLGAPLCGSRAATFAGWKNFVFGILPTNQESSNTLLSQLEANSSTLDTIVANFGKLTKATPTQAGIEIHCFYETLKTNISNAIHRKLPSSEILLVDKASACLDCHDHIPLNVRHAMMNKYRGPEDPNFKFVSGRIKDVVEKIRSNRLTPEEQALMRSLSFHYQDQKDVNPNRVPATCAWFLNHTKFLAWRSHTAANLLWVTAGPGCGKSVLSKALIDEGLLNPDNPHIMTTSICYFFFKDDAERGSGVNALRSILHQLFKQRPNLIGHAISEYQINGSNLSFATLWDIFIKAVSDPNAGPVVCLLDALDECETATRERLINRISSFYSASNKTSSKLKFIMTSRPYHELSATFEVDDLPSIQLDGNEVLEDIGAEIDLVIDYEIPRISKARHPPLDAEIQASLVHHIKKQKNRTYLWVYLMLKEISKSLHSTERKLTRLLETIPKSVDDAYEKILKRTENPIPAQKVLRLILASKRPLSLKEMNIALEVLDWGQGCTSEDDLDLETEDAFRNKIGNLCGLFISIVDRKIYLIHQTAKEFLIKNPEITSVWSPSCWKHTFSLQESHSEALKACLLYLGLCQFQDTALDQRGRIQIPQFAQDHPLFSYSSINWTFHFQRAGNTHERWVAENALKLCNTKTKRFLLWYQIFKRQIECYLPNEESSDLTIVSFFGLTSVVRLLVRELGQADVEAKDARGRTPLSWAAARGHDAVVKLLLEAKAEVEAKDNFNYGRTPLLWAAKEGYEAVVKLLLEAKAEVEAKDVEGQTPLLWAAREGYEAVVKLLLEAKAEVEAKDVEGQTPLLWAAREGYEAVVKLLLEAKAEVEAKDVEGQTPLLWAAREGYEAVVKLLLEAKAEVEAKDAGGRTPLSWAAGEGHEAVVKLLFEAKADVEVKDGGGWTPLLWAAAGGHEAVVKLLLKAKAEVEAEDAWGRTPLSWAAGEGHDAVVKLLLEAKAKVEAKNAWGRTPLSWAAEEGYEAVVKLLFEAKADVEVKDGGGWTPLLWAAAGGHEAVVKLLLKAKAEVEAEDAWGRTPLSWAAEEGYEAVVKLLFEIKADVEVKDVGGWTPLSLKSSSGSSSARGGFPRTFNKRGDSMKRN